MKRFSVYYCIHRSSLFGGIGLFSAAQTNGLERIIVEKYYVSSKQDSEASNLTGKLAKGSVTYRVFVDLVPGHRFSMAYGSSTHPLFFKTNTYFYNHIENGSTVASTVLKRKLSKNTLMLDSWLSVGTAAEADVVPTRHKGRKASPVKTIAAIAEELNAANVPC